jgi:adenosine deaminase
MVEAFQQMFKRHRGQMRLRSAWQLLFCLQMVFTVSGSASQAFRQPSARPVAATASPQRPASSAAETPEQKTARLMDSVKSNGPSLYAFLKQMPKGTDLHNHLTGAAYAETYARFAAESHLCLEVRTMTLMQLPCKDGQVDAAQSLTDPVLYRQMIDAWSMRGWNRMAESGHDHFFDTFYRFHAAAHGHNGELLAEVVSRAADGKVQYLELMESPDGGKAFALAAKIQWDENFGHMRDKLLASGMSDLVAESRRNLDAWEADRDRILNCREHNKALVRPGCDVTVRYIYPVLRAVSPVQVFSQMLLAFELARQDSRMVAVNMVQPEDWLVPLRDFGVHMRILSFLKELYPNIHVSLHAGELAPGMVPPEALRFHIRESVEVGHAERIGHGVDVMYEQDPQELLEEMARLNVMVEINLSSNDVILGVRGAQHPLAAYLKAGVPVALSTDDEGVARSEITREYQRAVEDQGLDYPSLKKMVRTGMEHAFLPGQSLWADARKFALVKECANEKLTAHPSGAACQKFLSGSEKARQQWQLEKALADFEANAR